MDRNLSAHVHFQALGAKHRPELRFAGTKRGHWRDWKDRLLPRVTASLGKMPEKVAMNAEIQAEWVQDGLCKQRIVFDVEAGLSVAAYVFRPADAGAPLPGILACHGHGLYGKEAVMGNRALPGLRDAIREYNYDYGLQMAKRGYAVIAIDWRGFGERGDAQWIEPAPGRDPCNLLYLQATLLGRTVLGANVHDGMCALDYLCGQDFVDPGRIGVMGLSFGGTMATWMSLCDERVKATDVICYSDQFACFAMKDLNTCGSQITPGLFALCDVADLQGLIAPRPLLVEIGTYDTCFKVDSAMRCFRQVEKIYAAAGAGGRLQLDLFEGGHQWSGLTSGAFFDNYLAADQPA